MNLHLGVIYVHHACVFKWRSILCNTGEKDMLEISTYLGTMETAQILKLGLAFGLNFIKLKNNKSSDTYLLDTVHSWLQKEEDVVKTGKPSWRTLVKALKSIGQTGIADQIAKDKDIKV